MRPIYQWPIRKPLAIFAAGLVAVVAIWSMWVDHDVPDNLKDLVQWFTGVVMAAYYASSTTEAVKGVGQGCPDDGGGGGESSSSAS